MDEGRAGGGSVGIVGAVSAILAGAAAGASTARRLSPAHVLPSHSPASTQMACRAGLAAAQLAQKLEAAARPVLAAVKAAAKQIVGLLRELDVRGAAALVVQHTAAAAAWVVAAVEPSVANVQRTASSWHAAAGPTLTTLSAAQLREKRRRALVAARTCVGGVRGWAHAKYATLDPAGRLPAAVKKVAKPPGVIYLLAGLGVASMLLSALLILAAG